MSGPRGISLRYHIAVRGRQRGLGWVCVLAGINSPKANPLSPVGVGWGEWRGVRKRDREGKKEEGRKGEGGRERKKETSR